MSGMKINFAKSQVHTLGLSDDEGVRVANLLNRKKVAFPMTYLGMPCSGRALFESHWEPTVQKLINGCEPWQGKLMSSASRLTLTNACISAIPTFYDGLVHIRRRNSCQI